MSATVTLRDAEGKDVTTLTLSDAGNGVLVTGTLSELAARYADAPPKGEIVVIVGPPGEALAEEADDDTLDAALREAMADKPVAQAAKAVAKRFGLDRHAVYARALTLKEQD